MSIERIAIDFAHEARRRQPLGLALLAAGELASAGMGLLWNSAWSAQATQAQTLAAMQRQDADQAAKATRQTTLTAAEQARQRAIQRVSTVLQTPWSDLLSVLEAAPHEHVALLAIEPSVARQQVRLTAEARNPESMIDFLTSLQSDARLSQVVLVSHQVQVQAPGKPVRFTLQAAWGGQP